jgi:hypothetical protein
MKVQGRTIEYFELPVYIQKVEEHNLHKDDFLKLFHKAPWWDIFVLTIDKYTKTLQIILIVNGLVIKNFG